MRLPTGVGGLAALLALFAPVDFLSAQAAPSRASLQVPEKIAEHVYLLHLPMPQFLDPAGNVIVIEQSDGLVLIDSGGYSGAGQHVVRLVKAISPKPVKALVLTHYHSDHSFGASAILAEWPKADFIAQEATLRLMAEGRPPGAPRQPSKTFEETRANALKSKLAQVEDAAKAAKTPQERAGLEREAAGIQQHIADLPGTYTILPRHLFKDRLDLPDRTTPVELLFLGRAHTPGDALAWLPSEKILVIGDIADSPVPYMFNIFPTEMLTVFKRMRNIPFRLMIPGHGTPLTRAYLDRVGSLVRHVRDEAGALTRQKLTLDAIKQQIDEAPYRRAFVGNDPWLGFWFDNYTWDPLIESVYHETRGDPLGPPPVKP